MSVMHNFFAEEKVSEINNAQSAKYRDGFAENGFVVGFAGRLVKRKGWRDFAKAALAISAQNSSFKFLIAGDGPDRNKLERLVGGNESIKLLGSCNDMPTFYRSLDCFVISSEWDPSPMVFYEAQRAGVPLISANVTAVNELVRDGENGLTYSPGHTDELIKKITTLKTNTELRQRLSHNGMKESEKYTLERYLEKVKKLYLNILA